MHHHHTHISSTHHHHHHFHHSTSTTDFEQLSYEQQVKAMKVTIPMGIFVILFSIGFAVGGAVIVLSSKVIPIFVIIPFLVVPVILIAVSVSQIVRAVKFLKSEPPLEQEKTADDAGDEPSDPSSF
ncbi:MAG: hypothetical protein SPL80_01015 [Bacilli bacterium]|nr:hypothetical protein [Bacilli bacterium]